MLYRFEGYTLDMMRRELRRAGTAVPVQPQVFDLLVYLIRNHDRVVSKDDLLEAVWGGRIVSESALTTRINAARTAIGDNGDEQRLIKTLPRKGIRFVGSVREEGAVPTRRSALDTLDLSRSESANGAAAADKPPALPDTASIAVLPFHNMSGDPQQDYFCDGMAEDIIIGLSRIKRLFVIARNSSFTYKGLTVDVKQVGRELGVRYVLEGSVRKAADRIRISGQLIDAMTGVHVWAERYDRKHEDVFALQDEVTLSVVAAIEPSLRQAEVERIKRKRPDSLDAYDLVLRAQPDVYAVMPDEVSRALVLLDRALALEPDYAAAHGYAAMCHHCLFLRGGLREENRAASIRHAYAAIAHGHDDAVALALAGFSLGMDGHDRAAASAAFDAALALSPSSAVTYILGSGVSGWGGAAERAIEWGERAVRLSPYDPWRFIAHRSLALGHFHLAQYEAAADAARRAIQYNPKFGSSYMLLAAPLAKLGRHDEAKTAVARLLALEPAFRYGKQFSSVGCDPALAASLGEALRLVGVPE